MTIQARWELPFAPSNDGHATFALPMPMNERAPVWSVVTPTLIGGLTDVADSFIAFPSFNSWGRLGPHTPAATRGWMVRTGAATPPLFGSAEFRETC